MTAAPKPDEVRRLIDEIARWNGRVLREYVQVHDWAYSASAGGSQVEVDTGAKGGLPSRQPIWEQDKTVAVALDKAKSHARGKARLAAESVRSAIAELRAAEALLLGAIKEREIYEDARRMALGRFGDPLPKQTRTELERLQRQREAREREEMNR